MTTEKLKQIKLEIPNFEMIIYIFGILINSIPVKQKNLSGLFKDIKGYIPRSIISKYIILSILINSKLANPKKLSKEVRDYRLLEKFFWENLETSIVDVNSRFKKKFSNLLEIEIIIPDQKFGYVLSQSLQKKLDKHMQELGNIIYRKKNNIVYQKSY